MNSFFARLALWVSLPLYGLDQLSKWWIVLHFPEPAVGYREIALSSWFHIIRVHNQGVAFGLGNGTPWAPVVFLLVPLLALYLLRVFWQKGVFADRWAQLAVALLLAGILGNLTDRLAQGFFLSHLQTADFWTRLSAGYVVDFISIWLPGFEWIMPQSGGWWPTFNVADSCVCTAAALLFLSQWLQPTAHSRKDSGR